MIALRPIVRPLLVSISFLLVLAPALWAAETVAVLLKDGTRYEDVTYRVRSEFSVLELRQDEETINVSFSDIRAIYDADGNDIARELLGKGYRPLADVPEPLGTEPDSAAAAEPDSAAAVEPESATVEPEPPPGEPSASRPQRRPRISRGPEPWNVALAVDGRMDLPFGDYYDGTDGGLGFGGTVHVRLSRDLALRGSVTRLGVDFGSDFGLVSLSPYVLIVSQNFDLTATRYLGGLEYHKSLGAPWGFWYVHTALGAIRHELKGEAIVYDALADQTYLARASDTDTRFTQQQGVGLIYGITDRLGLVGSVDFDFVWTEVTSFGGGTSSAIKGFIVAGSLGLAVRL